MSPRVDLLRDLWRMGLRNVGRNRRRSLIAGSMVALAVMGIVFFKGYTLGIKRIMLRSAVDAQVGAFQLQREGYAESQDLAPLELDMPDGPELFTRLLGLEHITGASPRLRFTGLISNGDISTQFLGHGVDPERERLVCPDAPGMRSHGELDALNVLTAGARLERNDEESIVLSDELAQGLKLSVGDSVTLLARTRNGSSESVDLIVKGIFHFDDAMLFSQFGVVPLGVAQRLLHMPGRASLYAVRIGDLDRLDSVLAEARALFRDFKPRLSVLGWPTIAPYYRDVITLQDDILSIVLVVVALIVLAGIVNTMMMATFERKREIGTLMSVGFRRGAIMVLFIIEALWLAVISGVAGAGAGIILVLVTHEVGIGFSIPGGTTVMTRPEIQAGYVAVAVLAAAVSALIAGLYPAYRASRMQPVDALRSD